MRTIPTRLKMNTDRHTSVSHTAEDDAELMPVDDLRANRKMLLI